MNQQPIYSVPKAVAAPLGAYSHSARIGDLVVVAGQVGVNASGELVEGLGAQTRQALANVWAILEAAGGGAHSVLKLTTYLVSTDEAAAFYDTRMEVFQTAYPSGSYPPSTLLIVERLVRPEFLVEIEAIAYVG